jgi:hypothetical protein
VVKELEGCRNKYDAQAKARETGSFILVLSAILSVFIMKIQPLFVHLGVEIARHQEGREASAP